MKNFEKFLTDLPKPAVEVSAFKESLRRELMRAKPVRTDPRWRWALGLTGSLAAALALVLVLFVARPTIPQAIHARLGGNAEIRSGMQGGPDSVAADRSFVDNWGAQQAQPASVRSVEAEKLFSVRQFELTDGKRMLVFTEFDENGAESAVMPAAAPASVY